MKLLEDFFWKGASNLKGNRSVFLKTNSPLSRLFAFWFAFYGQPLIFLLWSFIGVSIFSWSFIRDLYTDNFLFTTGYTQQKKIKNLGAMMFLKNWSFSSQYEGLAWFSSSQTEKQNNWGRRRTEHWENSSLCSWLYLFTIFFFLYFSFSFVSNLGTWC